MNELSRKSMGGQEITVVIPALNEEPWLARSLQSLGELGSLSEVIVADYNSQDQTREVARTFGCRVISGGRPARARNLGAAAAETELLVFMDADTLATPHALEVVMQTLRNPSIVAVHFPIKPITTSIFCKICYWVANRYFAICDTLSMPQGLGNFLAVKRAAFLQVGGFDEEIQAAEDVDLYRRLGRLGSVEFSKEEFIYTSGRRFVAENPFVFALKCLLWAPLRLVGSKRSLLGYRWISHSPKMFNNEEDILRRSSKEHQNSVRSAKENL